MGVKELLSKLSGKGNKNREMVNSMADQIRMERLANERQLSPNERELRRLRNEDREEAIKDELEFARRKRNDDIARGHNPLDTENIITKPHWEVLKEKSQFVNKGSVFDGTESIMKNNPNLLKTNQKLLKSNQKLLTGGNMFRK